MEKLSIVGCQSGVAGRDVLCGEGPKVIQSALMNLELPVKWEAMIVPNPEDIHADKSQAVSTLCTQLASTISTLVKQHKFFCVVAGDHSSAIGTWSGVYDAMHQQGDLGLIWIDAHMDAHTPETSPSGNIHGMPLACLLGYGYKNLISILQTSPKLKPENICLIGVRSFEEGEENLLKNLGVKVYFMDEVYSRGFKNVMQEAMIHVKKNTVKFGITIDIDAIDPLEAPGVDVPEPNGIRINELRDGFHAMINDEKLIGVELVEFDPHLDINQQTEKLVVSLIEIAARKNMLF